jgi:RNA polymerase-binding transcription factor DksA
VKPPAKAAAPAAKSAAKPAAKPGSKTAPKAPVLNAGAAKAKALAEARAAAAAAEAERKRIPRLVPATPGAIRPGAAKVVPTKGKGSNRPPAEVRPIGVLPPESMAKPKTTPTLGRIVIPERSTTSPAANAARMAAGTEVTLTKADLAYFEQRLLKERSRIAGEMGHLESSILKVNPRNPGGLTGDYTFNMADAGTDSMEREISFDIASKEGRLLREIDDALRRLYNGVYGLCESSGKMIARARLEALPWARYTVQEQENIERQQRAGRLAKEDE